MMNKVLKTLGICAPLVFLAVCACFLFVNPSSNKPASLSTMGIVTAMLVLPSLLVLYGVLTERKRLVRIGAIWALPYGMYAGLASIPSIWNIFALCIVCYWIVALAKK